MGSSTGALAWPWWGRLLPKGNQSECWDPALGPNVVGLPVYLPPQCTPDTPYISYKPLYPAGPWLLHSLPAPNAPLTPPTLPDGPQCPWWPKCSLTPPTPLVAPNAPWCPLYPCWPWTLHSLPSPMHLWHPLHALMAPTPPTPLLAPLPLYPCWLLSPYTPCQPPIRFSGAIGAVGEFGAIRGALGAGRECRYSEASRGIGSIRALGDCQGGMKGHQWV